MPILLTLLLLAAGTAPQDSAPAAATRAETPAEEFQRIGKELYEGDNPYVGSMIRTRLEEAYKDPALPPDKKIELALALGKEYLKGTQVDQAIETYEGALALAQKNGLAPFLARLHRMLGLAYLRQAEQENCVRRHNAECCIFPLEGGAIHTERKPAERSREHYLKVLELAPDDLEALWLLNITPWRWASIRTACPRSGASRRRASRRRRSSRASATSRPRSASTS